MNSSFKTARLKENASTKFFIRYLRKDYDDVLQLQNQNINPLDIKMTAVEIVRISSKSISFMNFASVTLNNSLICDCYFSEKAPRLKTKHSGVSNFRVKKLPWIWWELL